MRLQEDNALRSQVAATRQLLGDGLEEVFHTEPRCLKLHGPLPHSGFVQCRTCAHNTWAGQTDACIVPLYNEISDLKPNQLGIRPTLDAKTNMRLFTPRMLDAEAVADVLAELERLFGKGPEHARRLLVGTPSWLLRVERGPKRMGPHPDDPC